MSFNTWALSFAMTLNSAEVLLPLVCPAVTVAGSCICLPRVDVTHWRLVVGTPKNIAVLVATVITIGLSLWMPLTAWPSRVCTALTWLGAAFFFCWEIVDLPFLAFYFLAPPVHALCFGLVTILKF